MIGKFSWLFVGAVLLLGMVVPGAGMAQGCVANAAFVADVTVPDDTQIAPGQAFQKVWRLQNSGTCDWTQGYALTYLQGDLMGAPTTTPVFVTVKPGQTTDFAVNMTAPQQAGTFTSYWQLSDDKGQKFGPIFFVRIVVPGAAPAPSPVQSPAAPVSQPVQEWKQFTTDKIEVSLPGSYEGGDPSNQSVQALIGMIRNMGPQYEETVRMLEQNPSLLLFLALDTNLSSAGFLTNLTIVTERGALYLPISAILEMLTREVGSINRVVLEKKEITLPPYEAGRMILQATDLPGDVRQVVYILKDGDNLWALTYSTSAAELDQRMPEFERSVGTFKPRY